MNGNGSSATTPSRQSTPSVIIATTSTSVSVPSKPARKASPAAISTASTSLVASAIRSPVRWPWKKDGPCSGEPLVQPHAQLDAQPERRAEEREAPAHAQQVDRDAHRHQDRDLAPQRGARHGAGDEPVDDVADAPRDEHGQHRDAQQHQRGARVRAPVAPRETGDELQQRHGEDVESIARARTGARAKKGQL